MKRISNWDWIASFTHTFPRGLVGGKKRTGQAREDFFGHAQVLGQTAGVS